MPRKKTVWIYALLIAIGVTGILIPVISYVQESAQSVICAFNQEGLSHAVGVYFYDDREECLPAENWCDIFIEERALYPTCLVCPASDAIRGESSYAMNKNIAGMKYSELPDDVVMFFETDKGCLNGPRNISITSRRHYERVRQYARERENYDDIYSDKDFLVYKDRFNQYGGPEDVACWHRYDGKNGCHITFVNGRVEVVTEDRIADLKWTVE